MAALQKGLGRGLGALFQDEPPADARAKDTQQLLPVVALVPNPKQPRRDFDDEALQGLADSIKSQGVLQPILVRAVAGSKPPRYEIVAGERRWRASQLAGLVEVPVLIRDLTDQDTLAIALIENLQREDLNPLEEALGIQELKEEFGLSQEQLAATLGKSRSAIANSLRLLNLDENAREALRSGAISAGHARAILALGSPSEQIALLNKIIAESLTVREAEGLAATQKSGTEAPAPAAPDAGLVDAATAPAAPEAAAAAPRPAPKKLPQSAILLDLQQRIAAGVGLPVRVSGQAERGRISITYSSKDELRSILQKMGVEAEL